MKRTFSGIAVALGLLLVFSGAPVSAGFYAGGSLGQASNGDIGVGDIDDGSFGTSGSVDDSDTAWKVYGGYSIMKFFGVEASWMDLGKNSINATSDGTGPDYANGDVTGTTDADGVAVAAMGTFPIVPTVRVFAKAGYLFWGADTSIRDTGTFAESGSSSGEDMLYGAGVVWDFPGPGAARAEYEQMDLDNTTVGAISAGVSFSF